MEIRTFWTIIMKSIGLWLLLNCFYTIPQALLSFSYLQGDINWEAMATSWIMLVFVIIIYLVIIRLFLFKTSFIIDLLKLDKHFNQDRININISYRSLLTAVVIIMGGLILLEGLPTLFNSVLHLLQPAKPERGEDNTPWLVYHCIRVIAGVVIMTNHKRIVEFIKRKEKE